MHFAQLWLNGIYLGAHASTYGEFTVRLDNVSGVVFGGENVMAVRADGSYGSEHWYGGAGLFREIQLVHTGPQAFVEQGVWLPPELPLGASTTFAFGEWENFGGGAATCTFRIAIFSLGAVIANATSAPATAEPGEIVLSKVTLTLPGDLPRWSGDNPSLFTAMVSLIDANGIAVDSRNMSVGFRATLWDADQGFFINGQPLRQRGFSHHNRFAGVGVAIPPRLDLFRAQVSRALGANIWRMSHNPYRTSLYDILDALGTLVWDENRDMGPSYKHQMHDMVKRGRNHASIVVNSLCNEIECGSIMNASGVNVVGAAMVNFSKTLDPTRPTTANSDSKDGLGSVIDVQGFSHAPASTFANAHAAFPQQPLVLSECCSCETQRIPRHNNYNCTASENSPGEIPFVAGSLGVWTLFDYFGEPPALWPYVSSSFGQLDLAGFPKGHAYWYTANWRDLKNPSGAWAPTARVLDVLDSPPCTLGGITATSSADSAELFVDGISLGSKSAKGNQVFWEFKAAPGDKCIWPVNQSGSQQCKGLTAIKSAKSAAECEAAACSKGYLAWQWGSNRSSSSCWGGTPESDPRYPCPASEKPAQWQGGSRGSLMTAGNATLVAKDANGTIVDVHTVLAPSGPPASVILYLDAPSVATATGEFLVLDGHDIALVRAVLVDGRGVIITSVQVNVTFSVLSGPGRLGGIGAGNISSHEQPNGDTVTTFGGLARALFIVSVDCVSVGRDRVRAVDIEGSQGPTSVLPETAPCPTEDIVIAADSPNLPRAVLHIKTSNDVGRDGVLAVARASTGIGTAGAVNYLRDFQG